MRISQLDEDSFERMLKDAPHRRRTVMDPYDDYTLVDENKPINVSSAEINIRNIPKDKVYAWFPYMSLNKESYQIVADAVSRGWTFVDRYAHPEIPVLTLQSRNSLADFQGLTRTDNPHAWDREEKHIKYQGLVLMSIDKNIYERQYHQRMIEFNRKYAAMNPQEFNRGKNRENGDIVMSITYENIG